MKVIKPENHFQCPKASNFEQEITRRSELDCVAMLATFTRVARALCPIRRLARTNVNKSSYTLPRPKLKGTMTQYMYFKYSFKKLKEMFIGKQRKRRNNGSAVFNPLSPGIIIQILLTGLHTFQ